MMMVYISTPVEKRNPRIDQTGLVMRNRKIKYVNLDAKVKDFFIFASIISYNVGTSSAVTHGLVDRWNTPLR